MNPIENLGEKIVIHWRTRDKESVRRIRERFGIPPYITINGLTPAVLKPQDKELFDETARRGYLSYWITQWSFNGVSYSW